MTVGFIAMTASAVSVRSTTAVCGVLSVLQPDEDWLINYNTYVDTYNDGSEKKEYEDEDEDLQDRLHQQNSRIKGRCGRNQNGRWRAKLSDAGKKRI